ncbi:MAG: ankyrin repeat domain-containing protein [Gammaproteobacteria bacterium]|nr:ankyrin repeat domain-containing protein [Gammaproteobacteria bacterium]
MKAKILFFAIFLFIIPITQAFGRAFSLEGQVGTSELEAVTSTFALVVYDDWQQPSKPIPPKWSYLLKLPANLQTNGYYGESFICCHILESAPRGRTCYVAIAHRGTRATWDAYDDFYEDFSIAFGKEPYQYYMNALSYVDLVKKYVDSQYPGSEYNIYYSQTGHSLGAILAELIVASGYFTQTWDSKVFDSPGVVPIIQHMQGLLPKDAFERVKNGVRYDFSGANTINTFNEQISPPSINLEFEHEDFEKHKIPLSKIGSPGMIYYFFDYTQNQHQMINFYDKWHSNTSGSKTIVYNKDFTWPIGFDAGYRYFISTDDICRGQYWNSYMAYMWAHSPGIHDLYKNFSDFAIDFKKHLKDGVNSSNFFAGEPINNNYNTLDNEILDISKPITPITAKKRPTLYDVINNNYDGHSGERRQIYANASTNKKLYYAVMCGDVDFTEKLIRQTKANINTQHGHGHYSLLQVAIMMGYLDMVQLLLKYHANPELADDLGNTALHTVAKERYEDAGDYAKVLIEGGANPNAKNKLGQTPVMVMDKHYHQGIDAFIKALVKR